MRNRPATPDEVKECKDVYKKILEAMDGHDITAILNILCFVVAELGEDLDMSKQEFVAQVVEQVSSAYDMFRLANSKPQGEA